MRSSQYWRSPCDAAHARVQARRGSSEDEWVCQGPHAHAGNDDEVLLAESAEDGRTIDNFVEHYSVHRRSSNCVPIDAGISVKLAPVTAAICRTSQCFLIHAMRTTVLRDALKGPDANRKHEPRCDGLASVSRALRMPRRIRRIGNARRRDRGDLCGMRTGPSGAG